MPFKTPLVIDNGQVEQLQVTDTLAFGTSPYIFEAPAPYSGSDKTDNYDVLTTDLGVQKTLTMNNVGIKAFNLPVLSSGDLFKPITLVKKGAGQVTVQCNTGQTIADSSTAGTIFDSTAGETYATLTIMAITTTQWVVTGMFGSWETT